MKACLFTGTCGVVVGPKLYILILDFFQMHHTYCTPIVGLFPSPPPRSDGSPMRKFLATRGDKQD